MPQETLSNRLEKLEKEINGLLKIQEQQCSYQNQMPHPHKIKLQPVQRVQSGSLAHKNAATLSCKCKPCAKTKSFIVSKHSTPQRSVLMSPIEFKSGNDYVRCPNLSTEGSTKQRLNEEREKVDQAHKIIEGLKEELCYSKARMCTMAKDMALLTDALQGVRNKYKNIKVFRKEAIGQIQQLKNINADLCRKLDQEMKTHAEQLQKVKEQENIRVGQKVKQEATKLLEQTEETYLKLQKANEKLKRDVQEINNKYVEAVNEIENLKSQINERAQSTSIQAQESTDLKALLRNERNKNAIINKTIDRLETTVADLMKVEKKAQGDIVELKKQLGQLENSKMQQTQELLTKDREYDELQCECQRLKKKINDLAAQDNQKCKNIEKEMEKLTRQMKDKESNILEEKNTLKCLVQELSEVVKKHKTRIKELVHINRQQEGLLKNQLIVLQNKEHHIKMADTEVETARSKTQELHQQIENLKNSLKNYEKMFQMEKEKEGEFSNKMNCILEELDETKATLQVEQDKLLIKEKIIDDQADTIKKLKHNLNMQVDELKQNNNEIAKLQKELANEKYDKEQLHQNIEDISWHKQQLKDQVTELEDCIRQKQIPPARQQLDQHKKLINSLEHQVTMKQKEWELRCKLLNTEKKRAVQAAKFATQKLVDTVNDFQNQTESQKQVQAMLTNMVQSKNKELKTACKKISDVNELMKKRCESDCLNLEYRPRPKARENVKFDFA